MWAGSCGWTADFEQLQSLALALAMAGVAAGLRILNSYNFAQNLRRQQ